MDQFRLPARHAYAAVWRIVEEANRYVVEVEPWTLAKAEMNGDADAGTTLSNALALPSFTPPRVVSRTWNWTPFLPGSAERVAVQLGSGKDQLDKPQPLFPRIWQTTSLACSGLGFSRGESGESSVSGGKAGDEGFGDAVGAYRGGPGRRRRCRGRAAAPAR